MTETRTMVLASALEPTAAIQLDIKRAELNGYLLMANMAFLLYGSAQPIERAREAIATRLALSRARP